MENEGLYKLAGRFSRAIASANHAAQAAGQATKATAQSTGRAAATAGRAVGQATRAAAQATGSAAATAGRATAAGGAKAVSGADVLRKAVRSSVGAESGVTIPGAILRQLTGRAPGQTFANTPTRTALNSVGLGWGKQIPFLDRPITAGAVIPAKLSQPSTWGRLISSSRPAMPERVLDRTRQAAAHTLRGATRVATGGTALAAGGAIAAFPSQINTPVNQSIFGDQVDLYDNSPGRNWDMAKAVVSNAPALATTAMGVGDDSNLSQAVNNLGRFYAPYYASQASQQLINPRNPATYIAHKLRYLNPWGAAMNVGLNRLASNPPFPGPQAEVDSWQKSHEIMQRSQSADDIMRDANSPYAVLASQLLPHNRRVEAKPGDPLYDALAARAKSTSQNVIGAPIDVASPVANLLFGKAFVDSQKGLLQDKATQAIDNYLPAAVSPMLDKYYMQSRDLAESDWARAQYIQKYQDRMFRPDNVVAPDLAMEAQWYAANKDLRNLKTMATSPHVQRVARHVGSLGTDLAKDLFVPETRPFQFANSPNVPTPAETPSFVPELPSPRDDVSRRVRDLRLDTQNLRPPMGGSESVDRGPTARPLLEDQQADISGFRPSSVLAPSEPISSATIQPSQPTQPRRLQPTTQSLTDTIEQNRRLRKSSAWRSRQTGPVRR